MAFVDIPDGCVCKALELHRTYFNGKQINVEETKNGGKHSAVTILGICMIRRRRKISYLGCENYTMNEQENRM